MPIIRFSSGFYVKFLELIEYGGNYWMPKHASREGYHVGNVLDERELVKRTPHPLTVHEELGRSTTDCVPNGREVVVFEGSNNCFR
nr:kinesin-like protein KIN-12C isoform X2 [Ipomoea batatas]